MVTPTSPPIRRVEINLRRRTVRVNAGEISLETGKDRLAFLVWVVGWATKHGIADGRFHGLTWKWLQTKAGRYLAGWGLHSGHFVQAWNQGCRDPETWSVSGRLAPSDEDWQERVGALLKELLCVSKLASTEVAALDAHPNEKLMHLKKSVRITLIPDGPDIDALLEALEPQGLRAGSPEGTSAARGESGILLPHEEISDEELDYLQPARRVLKVGEVGKAEWFWRQGPRAIDFDKDVVYRRKDQLDELKKLVFDHPFSVLEGKAATGKTVLVRNLLYDLLREGRARLYHFAYRPFDVNELAREINSIRGVVVLEDVHRDMLTFQRLYSLLRGHPQRHVLFTARSHFRDLEIETREKLGRLPSLPLVPFKDADGIIAQYCSQHPDVEWPPAVLRSVKEVAKESFWLVAFALEGCEEKAGKGEPKEWIAAGVKQTLKDIEKLGREELGRQLAERLPQVLVALSPLYLGEVCTAETFLVNELGLDLAVISTLVDLGEITRQESPEGDVLYGLPHSGLAGAYWEHGTTYRRRLRLPGYEDFLYKYAVANTPNGLEAVARADAAVRTCVLKRLVSSGKAAEVVGRERSILAFHDCIGEVVRLGGDDENLLANVAEKIARPGQLYLGGLVHEVFCRAASRPLRDRLWRHLDWSTLAEMMVHSEDLKSVLAFIRSFRLGPWSPAGKLWEALRPRLPDLAANLRRSRGIHLLIALLEDLASGDPVAAGGFAASLDATEVAAKVVQSAGVEGITHFVGHARLTKFEKAREIIECMDVRQLAAVIASDNRAGVVGSCIAELYRFQRDCAYDLGSRVLCALDKRRLAEVISTSGDVIGAAWCVWALWHWDRAAAGELWRVLNFDKLAATLVEVEETRLVPWALGIYHSCGEGVAAPIWSCVDLEKLAQKVLGIKPIVDIPEFFCVLEIRVSREAAVDVVGALGRDGLASLSELWPSAVRRAARVTMVEGLDADLSEWLRRKMGPKDDEGLAKVGGRSE